MIDLTKGKRVMHIDTSQKLYERKISGIAYKMVRTKEHKGLALSLNVKKELEKRFDADHDYARLYAICIYYLIREDLDIFDELIICNDEDFFSVKEYLRLLFIDEPLYQDKSVKSIYELRCETGMKNIRSYADDVAYSYMRRALKNICRRQRGTPLNVVPINFDMIKEKWLEIDRKIKGGE